jgi:hypothetical protein
MNNVRSIEKLFDNNKENFSLNSNLMHHVSLGRETHQSKSFINAMKALQEKCRRLESEKVKLHEDSSAIEEHLRKENEVFNKSLKQAQLEIEQKSIETIEMKSRLTILEQAKIDSEKLIRESERLKEERSRL